MASTAYPRGMIANSSATDATSYATATSPTLTNGAVLTAWVATVIAAGTPNTPTATGTNGLNGTWTAITNVVQDQIKLTLFRSTAQSTTAGVLTFDLAGQTNSAAAWGLTQWANVNTTINVQSTTGTANAGTTIAWAAPLAAFGAAFNTTYAIACVAGSFLTVRSNITQGLMSIMAGSSISGTEVSGADFYSGAEVNSPSIDSSGAGDIVGIAIEVSSNASSGGGGSLVGGLLVR